MKMLLKLMSAALCLAMLLSFAACGDDTAPADDKTETAATTGDSKQDVGDVISSAMLQGTWTADIDYMAQLKEDCEGSNTAKILDKMSVTYPAKVSITFTEDGTYEYKIADEDAFEDTTDAFEEDYFKAMYDFQVEENLTDHESYDEWRENLPHSKPTILLEADRLDREGDWYYADGKLYMSEEVCDSYFEITIEGDTLTFTKGVDTFTYIEDALLPIAFTKAK